MPHRSRMLRYATSLLLIVSLASLAFADTIRLKDGSILKGKIISFGGGKFLIAMGEGSRRRELAFSADEVESIKFDDPSTSGEATNRTASYKKTDAPILKPAKDPAFEDRNGQPRNSSGDKMKPIAWTVKVLADSTANGWTNTGWVVKKGQRIRISGDGKVSLGHGQTSTASGLPALDDSQKLLKNVATGALIAVIGDDNNDFIYIGAEREITATRDGALFLGINEGNLDDNSGFFNVKIEVVPDGAE